MISRNVIRIDAAERPQEIEAAIRRRASSRRCGDAERWSGSPAASTAPSSPRCALARSARSASRDSSCPNATRRATRSGSGRMLADHLGIEYVVEDIGPDACGSRLLSAAGRGDPDGLPGVRSRLEVQARPPVAPRGRSAERHPAHRRRPGGDAEHGAHAADGLPPARRGDELQAAHAQDDRVLPRRPAQLRRRGHAQPARVRPGLLREAGRRRRRLQADRPPLQDAGLRARRRTSACRERDPRAAADDRHLLACRRRRRSSTSRLPYAADGPLPVGARTTASRRRRSAARSASPRSRSSASTATSRRSGGRAGTCTTSRRW